MADEIAQKSVPQLKQYIKTVYNGILQYQQANPNIIANHFPDWPLFVQRHNEVDDQDNRDILQEWALQGLDIWQGVLEILEDTTQAAGLKRGSGLSNHWGFLLNPDHPAMK